jgi:CTP-dependent riboflavin kinase
MYSKEYLGTVEEGGKSSAKWMPQYIPWLFPGTLNVRMRQPIPEIFWSEEKNTHYGEPCRIARCKINNIDAFIINPPEVSIVPPQYLAEIAHKSKLRDMLSLKNGDTVSIVFDIK